MKDIGCDPKGQHPLPGKRMDIPIGFRHVVTEAIKAEGYKKGPWFYKDATICLNWPVWHKAFPSAKWVIVRRPDEDIVDSCLRTVFMSAYQDKEGWQRWVDHHKACFDEMIDTGLNVHQIWTNRIVEDQDFYLLETMIHWLGLTWDEDKVREFVDGKLWKRSAARSDKNKVLT